MVGGGTGNFISSTYQYMPTDTSITLLSPVANHVFAIVNCIDWGAELSQFVSLSVDLGRWRTCRMCTVYMYKNIRYIHLLRG